MSYEYWEQRWGAAIAMYLVREIEKVAKVAANENLPPNERLKEALRVQDSRIEKRV